VTKVKICGITNYEDAKVVSDESADFIGFNFYRKSPRYIEPERARDIIMRLGTCTRGVGIFVNETAENVQRIFETANLDVIQLHGDEDAEFCASFHAPVIKAFRVAGPEDLAGAEEFKVWAALVDSRTPEYGGSGVEADRELASRAAKMFPRFFLAGGLDPDNVGGAIRAVEPWGVDTASGVEKSPGIKDHDKIRKFIKAVRNGP